MKKIFTLNLSALLLIACLLSTATMARTGDDIVPGNLIVQMQYKKDINNVVSAMNEANPNAKVRVDKVLSETLNIWLLKFDVDGISEYKALTDVQVHPDVAVAQYDHANIKPRVCPNDTNFGDMWAMFNDGTNGSGGTADISACDAWDVTTGGFTAQNDRIVVAVVDGGFDLNHEDMNWWVNSGEVPNNNQDDDNNGYVDDVNGWDAVANDGDVMFNGQFDDHGTHVAGTVGAIGDNNLGVTGVNQDVDVMPITGSSGQESVVVAAYGYVLKQREIYNQTNGAQGAFVVATNSSFGVDGADPNNYPIWCAFYDSLGAYGILSATATANNNVNVDVDGDVPTACPSDYMISVTNTNSQDQRATAGYGLTTIDLGAPGSDIMSTEPNDTYGRKTGTSMATPHIAGTIGLMWAAACDQMITDYKANPGALAMTMRNYLLNDGWDAAADLNGETVTGGRLNLHKAVLAVDQYAGCANSVAENHDGEIIFNVYPNPNSGWFSVDVTNAEAGDYTVEIRNVLGQLIETRALNIAGTSQLLNFNLSSWERGTYFIRTIDEKGRTNVTRVVID